MRILLDFLGPRFPYHNIIATDYSNSPCQPGDYTSPYITINDRIVGYLQEHYTVFIPGSYPNAREKYKAINLANPDFFEIFHKVAIYEFGYNPLDSVSREVFIQGPISEYEAYHKDLYEIYWSLDESPYYPKSKQSRC